MEFIQKGLFIGLLFGIPIGTVGTMVIQNTITAGKRIGFITGLGSSAADMIYACIGAFGLTYISDLLFQFEIPINLIGGFFLIFMGILAFREKEHLKIQKQVKSFVPVFIPSFIVGITNPVTILTFLFAFSLFSIPSNLNQINAIGLIVGILLGTIFWWGFLVEVVSYLKRKMIVEKFKYKNSFFGSIYIIFGSIVLIRIVLKIV